MSIKEIIKSSLVTAFTIAAALIWKDVIIEIIEKLVPAGEELFYKILAAVIATGIVILAIYLVLKTESEAEIMIKKAEEMAEKYRHRGKQTKKADNSSPGSTPQNPSTS